MTIKRNFLTVGDIKSADQDDVAFSTTHHSKKEDLIARMLADPHQCHFGQKTVRWLFDKYREVRRELHDLKAAPLHAPAAPAAEVKTTLERLADLVLANQEAGTACFISVPPAAPDVDVERLRARLAEVVKIVSDYDSSYSGRLEALEALAGGLTDWRDALEKEAP